ncbi:nuclease (SNase domain-containing protein) [Oleidesulfovibrio alaskensis G20]|jgi:endonuclease YncB( thermonuclease family)|uniref:Nuclease (SNase domain-containing protein) n=1 Tax=Oleidesulfovibrio alaskensis (strain ATCC BAA-1058 / DSM 17464 / G20) TaxID=207559 RepID=Q30ZP8_OLEA2|nr:thermonuclease family protein [Oleidesulfovibrio alaskensis]ABB38848.1 nuclease (SNase domain-containing protein) [Oleidesulfovibrio alaskensis G20]
MHKKALPVSVPAAYAVMRLCLCTFLLACFACTAEAGLLRYDISSVPDGDTIVLAGGTVVRLRGIDAPEVGRNGHASGFYAHRAHQQLVGLLKKRQVLIDMEKSSRDRYGRVLADVYLPDRRLLSEVLVASGAAWLYQHADTPVGLRDTLLAAQRRAITAKTGMWRYVAGLDTPQGGYRGNRRSMRFFTQKCEAYYKISYRNVVHFDTLTESFMAGMAPARSCDVWPLQ